jgi:hypothetical protein
MKKLWGKLPKLLRSKKALRIYLLGIGLFIVLNGAVWVAFQNRSYPSTSLAGQALGSVAKADMTSKLDQLTLLPANIFLIYKDSQTKTTPDGLGIQVDTDKTVRRILDERSWLPIANLFTKHEVSFASKTDSSKLQAYVQAYAKKHDQKPTNAKITLKNGEFSVVLEKPGSRVEPKAAASDIVSQLGRGQAVITLQPQEVPASVTAESLNKRLSVIQKQQQTKVTVRYQTRAKTFTPAEIARWYELEGSRAELADSNIQASITGVGAEFGILVKNMAAAVAAAKAAVEKNQPLEFVLVAAPKPTKAFSYCTAVRGVSSSYLAELTTKLASTYNDTRGWNLNGQVRLTKVATGCDFTVWLSAASQMPTFGSICDSTWSCRSGSNVVINFTRWQNASPAWNAKGGNLEDYRSMVINHETGHWFGFYHKNCGGAGQAAPVMQQQSIDLQGCKFNPWPLPSERAELKKSLRL